MLILALMLWSIAPGRAEAGVGDGGVYIYYGDGNVSAAAQFILENEAGQRTGRLPDGTYLTEIPGTDGAYSNTSVDDHVGESPSSEMISFETTHVPPGNYQLKLLPVATTSYELLIEITQDNGAHVRTRQQGFLLAGATVNFQFRFDPTQPAPTPVAKVVSFDQLRESSQAALTMGQLGDAAFVSRLNKMLLKAASFADKGQGKQAADRLGQFIHRLESAFKHEPDINAGDDPDDVKNAASMKRFVTANAKDSLETDARTLIASLGETPKK